MIRRAALVSLPLGMVASIAYAADQSVGGGDWWQPLAAAAVTYIAAWLKMRPGKRTDEDAATVGKESYERLQVDYARLLSDFRREEGDAAAARQEARDQRRRVESMESWNKELERKIEKIYRQYEIPASVLDKTGKQPVCKRETPDDDDTDQTAEALSKLEKLRREFLPPSE